MGIQRNRMIMLALFIFCMLFPLACGEAAPADIIDEKPSISSEDISEPEVEVEISEQMIEEISVSLPPDPIQMEFTTSDEITLDGVFYPAASSFAPLIMLMHWAPGDQDDWVEIAYWLQNRKLGGNSPVYEMAPWLDASWFPQMDADNSFNVFTFTFRNCAGGCKSFEREKWYTDVQAAVDFAFGLNGIKKETIIMIGASIGSDGVVDGCAYLNQSYDGVCKGAFSLSPGNYLTINYEEKVLELDPIPVWCLYAESDPESAEVCGNITADNYTTYSYSANEIFSNGHGMNLIAPDLDPNALTLMLAFINQNT